MIACRLELCQQTLGGSVAHCRHCHRGCSNCVQGLDLENFRVIGRLSLACEQLVVCGLPSGLTSIRIVLLIRLWAPSPETCRAVGTAMFIMKLLHHAMLQLLHHLASTQPQTQPRTQQPYLHVPRVAPLILKVENTIFAQTLAHPIAKPQPRASPSAEVDFSAF